MLHFAKIFKFKKIFFLLAISIYLASCQTRYVPEGPPPSLPKEIPIKKPVNVALVLGAGGARGVAHLGVLEVLEEAGIKIDLIVGSSAGSIIGALYSDLGCTCLMKQILLNTKRQDLLKINLFNIRYGLSSGTQLITFLHKHLSARNFNELQIPLRIVTTDLSYGKLVVFGGGPLIPAIYASSAFPGVLHPVNYCGRMFVDGGVLNPVPIDVAAKYNPKFIIVVDLTRELSKNLPSHVFGVFKRSLEVNHQYLQTCAKERSKRITTIVIKPDLIDIDTFDNKANTLSYETGKKAAYRAIRKLCKQEKKLCENKLQ